ncbi:tyramine receptor tyra-2-like [Orbicella faveolata]|uniref:tyramine receptor tyra-2-like n=1 Tax=Orbicella faveolata TaxID=48498 RepID=UPI0009E635B8|nr:tyramine receptor tyra-2-like [Orbicella faveolata]
MGLGNETKLDRNLETPSRTSGIFFAVVLILTAVVNIISNVLVLVVLARNNRLRTCTNFFIANLSVIDLLAGIILIPAAADSLLAQERKISDDKVCAFYGFLNSVYGIASSLTVAVIALDRYHSILNCLQYETIVTQRRTALVLVWIWFQSTFVSLCPLVGWGRFSLSPSQSCSSHLQDKNGFIFFKTASCVVLPYAITVFCYTRIHVVARRHARTIVNIQIRDARNRRLKSGAINLSASKKTVMVYVVLGVYTICWLPYYTIPPLVTVYPEATIPVTFILTATVLSLVNSACNPIMYALITSQFRNGLKRVYRRIRRSIFSGDVRHLNPTGPRGDSRSSWTFTRSSARRFFATSQDPGRPKLVMDLNPACAVIKEEESSMNTRAVEKPDAGINCPPAYPLTLQVPNEQWHKNKKTAVRALADGGVKKNGWIGD